MTEKDEDEHARREAFLTDIKERAYSSAMVDPLWAIVFVLLGIEARLQNIDTSLLHHDSGEGLADLIGSALWTPGSSSDSISELVEKIYKEMPSPD